MIKNETGGLILSTTQPVFPFEIRRNKIESMIAIGKGNFGDVFRGILASGRNNKVTVAIKSLHTSESDAGNQEMLLSEAALMAQFDHINVIKLIGVVTVGNPVLVVMEYCEHGALESYLKETDAISRPTLMKFASDSAHGMEYLSRTKFVHRDLASRNVLLSNSMTCKISDFGMSRTIVNKEYYRSRGGLIAVRWTAPEALEQQVFSEQSDVWSFGVLMWEIWSRADLPYSQQWSNEKVWAKVLAGFRLACPFGCPGEIFQIMLSCWSDLSARPHFSQLIAEIDKLQQQISSSRSNSAQLHYLIPDQQDRRLSSIDNPFTGNDTFSNDLTAQDQQEPEFQLERNDVTLATLSLSSGTLAHSAETNGNNYSYPPPTNNTAAVQETRIALNNIYSEAFEEDWA